MTTVPTVGPIPQFTAPAYERIRFSNGFELLVVSKRAMPIVDIQLIVRGGGTIDPVDRAGRASMTAEMLDEGTAQRSALEISQYVEQLGADLDVRAGWDAGAVSACAVCGACCETSEELVDAGAVAARDG